MMPANLHIKNLAENYLGMTQGTQPKKFHHQNYFWTIGMMRANLQIDMLQMLFSVEDDPRGPHSQNFIHKNVSWVIVTTLGTFQINKPCLSVREPTPKISTKVRIQRYS
jgi:hypothetical protein